MKQQIRLVVEYNGAGFCGWQEQPEQRSIQTVLHQALVQVLRQEVSKPVASGRTDSGVHARRQVVSFYCDTPPESLERLAISVSSILKNELSVHRVDLVGNEFHPVRDAKAKRYTYQIYNSPLPPVLRRNFVCHISRPLNLKLLKEEAKALVGTHDFTSFRASGCGAKTPVKTITDLCIEASGSIILIRVTGNGFLKQMVRNIVGTMILIGTGRQKDNLSLKDILEAKDRKQAGPTAEAHALFLDWVEYEEGIL